MKRTLVIVVSIIGLLSCSFRQDDPVEQSVPEVEFISDFSPRTISAGESVEFSVKVVSSKKATPCWYVDGILEGSGETFSFTFDAPGEHTVDFEIGNGKGKVTKQCVVVVADALRITVDAGEGEVLKRFQYNSFGMVAVVWNEGLDVTHSWYVDGEKVSDGAFLKDVLLDEVRTYSVRYVGSSALGTFERNFSVQVELLPIEIGFNHPAGDLVANKNKDVNIVATPLHDGVVASQTWTLNKQLVSEDKDFSMKFTAEGYYLLVYEAVNPDGYTFRAQWDIFVEAPKRVVTLMTDFEDLEDLPAFLISGSGNTPGITVVDNPHKTGTNTSEKCLSDYISNKKGNTSGYFTLSFSGAKEMGFNLNEYTGVRFKIWLGTNNYLPRIQFGSETATLPVDPPQYTGGWETIEFEFGKKITTYLTVRPMLTPEGSNVGAYSDTNTMQIYIDDIELF